MHSVRNPLTGRYIKVGGKTYLALKAQGVKIGKCKRRSTSRSTRKRRSARKRNTSRSSQKQKGREGQSPNTHRTSSDTGCKKCPPCNCKRSGIPRTQTQKAPSSKQQDNFLKKLSEERKKELAKLREQKSVSGRRGEVERKLSELSSYKHKLPKEREEELASVRGQTSISERAEELQKKLHFR